ncbi:MULTISPECIES: HlyC/CorC family transporter [Caulobacter]|uniref:Putative Mg2+ and Co2+ transporter CorB n=1 Tax=Caulobacter vibrioides OR37 TaxID=1292034 RepID=R0E5S3_CAUVI|nr:MULTISPECIES: HlyC/CorC family transporter [Caulobacter]ENZ80918.1 putative Mg2+ and Co2+ transporter CorB [Caulobacter vibrioides OR37]MBQ1560166.1 HlyC/CorC family transporter [Caulobacter sp.]
MLTALLGLAPIVIALLTLSALFSAAETSMTGASRARMHQLEREGDRPARRVNKLLSDQETMIGAVLLGNNLINILASALATQVLTAVIPGPWGVAAATATMTVLVLVFAEVLPKTVAIVRSDDVARALSGPTLFIVRAFGPIIYVIQWIVRRALRVFGVKLDMAVDVLAAHEEIRGAVDYHHSEGLVETDDRRMLGGVLDLSDMDVSEIMVHRKSMVLLDADLPARQLVETVLEAQHTRIPVYRDEPENIVGVLHARDLLKALAEAKDGVEGLDIAAILREPWFIPDTTNLKDQLNAFLKRKSHFALVVDEYGALQGLVTLEDILEEIVGEIEDEHDTALDGVRRQQDGSVNVDGDVTVRDLNRALDWRLPEGEAVTIAGLVIHEAQTIPEPGQTFIFHRHRFQVLRRQRNQITALRISAPLAEDADI